MLAGKSKLAICYRLPVLHARLRAISSFPHHTPVRANVLGPYTSPVHGLAHRLLQVTFLSNSTLLSVSARQQASKFLKPRLKPKFRQRTTSENDEFLAALKEAEAQYEAQLANSVGHGEVENHVVQQTGDKVEEALTSSFFAIPDVGVSPVTQPYSKRREEFRTRHQDELPGLRRISRNDVGTADLENELYYLSHNDPHPTAIHNILTILIRDRKIKPASQHYEALILANTWPEYGSVDNVESILAEIEGEGIEIGGNIVSAILKVLAVHPSLEISRRLLSMVEQRWIQLPLKTHHHLILATIRTGQVELGAWMLDALRDKNKATRSWDREIIPDYLVVLLIAEMVKIEDWEGILRYMYKLRNRRAADREIPVEFWGWLLERAARTARYVTGFALSGPRPGPTVNDTKAASLNQTTSSSQNYNTSNKTQRRSDIQTQLSLSNPAFHLTEHIYTHYVTNMSHRPSYTVLLNILHCAVNTGTLWLAKSVLATMTYMDGIDDTGRPIAHISDEVKALIVQAEARASANETEEQRAEKARKEAEARERKRIDEEDEVWWKELMDELAEEERVSRGASKADDGTESQTPRSVLTNNRDGDVLPSTSASESENGINVPLKPNDATSPPPSTATATKQPYLALDRTTVPPGNLWPLFPPMAGIQPHTHSDMSINVGDFQSAHVDPWDALGPRMSARRKWTDAQAYYKAIERAAKKKY